jgi:hypothetical protein
MILGHVFFLLPLPKLSIDFLILVMTLLFKTMFIWLVVWFYAEFTTCLVIYRLSVSLTVIITLKFNITEDGTIYKVVFNPLIERQTLALFIASDRPRRNKSGNNVIPRKY